MSDEYGQSSKEGIGDPNTPTTVVVAAVSAIVLVIVIILLEAFFYRAERAELQRKVVTVAPWELSAVRAEQLETLNSYRWIDEKQGIAAIPIERAMALIAAENARQGGAAPAPATATGKAR